MFLHQTVMQNELVKNSLNYDTKIAIDCTAGGGGHTQLLLSEMTAKNKLIIAFDRDPTACHHLENRFKSEIELGIIKIINQPFSELSAVIAELNLHNQIDTIIADLGISSPQIDSGDRGFSFMKDGPLDMRMDPRTELTAAMVVNTFEEAKITEILRQYGEETKASIIAKKICLRRTQRPFITTLDLSNLIGETIYYNKASKKNPATKTFQALRIFINGELDELALLLKQGMDCLKVGGKFGIITFHSLEDRIVKQYFKNLSSPKSDIPHNIPLTAAQLKEYEYVTCKTIGSFPALPSQDEIDLNPRARSAKLRVVQKINPILSENSKK